MESLHCKAWKGNLKATRRNKLHLQENSMRIDLEANQTQVAFTLR